MRLSRSFACFIPLAATLACSDRSPAGPAPVASVAVTPPTDSVIAGTTRQLTAAPRDRGGSALTGRTVTWRSGAAGVATVTEAGLLTGVAPGDVVITATSEGQSGTASITVLPVPVASVVVSPPTARVVAGTTQQLTAAARDAGGNPLAGRAITWASSNPGVAVVDGAGLLTAVAPGDAVITATSEGQSGTAAVTVIPVPVATVVVTPATASVAVGGTQQLSAATRDGAGNALTGRVVAWSSGSAAVATVDAAGLLTAVAPGTVTVTATSDGQSGTAAITVVPASDAPAITSVSPSPLTPGGTATITGTGFDALAASNAVTVRGVAAPILSASPTRLIVMVPCVESGTTGVRVVTRGVASTSFAHPVAVAQRSLAVGQSLVLTTSAPSTCNELVTAGATARYLVAVFSASTSASTLVDFDLAGNTPAEGVAAERVEASRAAPVRADAMHDAGAAHDDAHWAMLERNRADYERLRGRARQAAARDPVVRAADLPALADMRSLYYTFSGGCSDTTRVIRGRAIYVGTRSIIWEDSANTLQSGSDAALAGFYQRLGQIFDQDQYESVKNNFADPLLRDGDTDADGRVHMVFSQRLNGPAAAAYVTSCDQFAPSIAPGSNHGQFFYGYAPTTTGSNLNGTSAPDGWFNFMARTVVHEVKHIASFSARIANNASYEQSWLEEGTARHAEELWVRESLHRVGWKANTGYGTASTNGVYCDFHPADAACGAADPLRRPSYGMRRHFNEIREKLVEPWNWSPYGLGAGQSGSVFYQTSWSLVRYAADRYATSEAAFFRALANATATGVSNLTAAAGVPLDQLVGGWGLALVADDYPGLASPSADVQFPTWNLRSIYAGLNASPAWGGRWDAPFLLRPAPLPFGSFTARVTGLRGGAHAYFELSGSATGPQLLALRSTAGGTPSSNLRLAIVRLQ